MKRFEHCIVSHWDQMQLLQMVDEASKDGWEAFGVTGSADRWTIFMKREIKEEELCQKVKKPLL